MERDAVTSYTPGKGSHTASDIRQDGASPDGSRRPAKWYVLLVLPWLLAVLLSVSSSRTHDAVAARQRTVRGTITGHEPSNHDRYAYAFTLNGKPYHGWEIPQRHAFQIGQTVTVYYDPRNPSTSALTDFADQSADDLGPVPLLVAGLIAIGVFLMDQWRRRGLA